MSTTANDILKTKPQNVWSVSPKAKVIEALKLMAEKEIGALIVLDDAGAVRGILSERDYARKVALLGKQSTLTAVEEIMTPIERVFTIKTSASVEDCMVLMTAKHIRHLPVFDGDAFVGLISIGDVVKAIIGEKQNLIEQLSDYISGKY